MRYNYQSCLTTSHQIHCITVHVCTSEASCLLPLTGASVSQFAFILCSLLLPTITSDPCVKPTYLFLHTITQSYILPSCLLFFEKLFSYYSLKNISVYMFSFSYLCEFQDPWRGAEVGNSTLFYKWRKSSVRWRVKVNCDLGKPNLL